VTCCGTELTPRAVRARQACQAGAVDDESREYLQQLRETVAELAAPWRTEADGPLTIPKIEPLLLRAAATASSPADRRLWEHAALLASTACWGDDWASETSRELWDKVLDAVRSLTTGSASSAG